MAEPKFWRYSVRLAMKNLFLRSVTLFLMVLGICGGATAADMAPMPTKAPVAPALAPVLSPWTYSATLYGWVPLLNGSTTVKGRTVDVDVDYNELMDLVRRSRNSERSFCIDGISRSAQWPPLSFHRLSLPEDRIEREHGALARR